MRYTDLPQFIGIDVYERARLTLTEKYGKTLGVLDVFEFGTIPLPGISDMDFHVIVKANVETSFPRMKDFAPDERYAMLHKQFVLTEESWNDFHYIDPWFIKGIALLGRVGVPARTLSEEDHHALSLYYILLNWLLPFLRTIAQIECTQELPVREMLEIIKGTAYPYREFKRMSATTADGDPSKAFFEELRSTWFTLNQAEQEERIFEAFHRFSKSIGTLLTIMNEEMKKRMHAIPTPEHRKTRMHAKILKRYPQSVVLDTGDDIFVYQKDRASLELFYETFRSPLSSAKPERGLYLLPLELSAIQNSHLMTSGPVSQWYKHTFATDLASIPMYQHPAIDHLLRVMNKNVEETKMVHGAKQPFTTFGMPSPLPSRSFRARLGRLYDAVLSFMTRTSIGGLLRNKKLHMMLPSS